MSVNRKRKPNFTNDEKFRLIQSVKKRSVLWDITEIYNKDYDKVQAAWNAVSEEVKRPGTECRMAWSSLRESYRYHFKRDCGKFQQLEGEDYDPLLATKMMDWRFAEAMSFMPQPTLKRPRPVSRIVRNETDGEDGEDGEDGGDGEDSKDGEDGEDIEMADWMTGSVEIPADALLTPGSIESIKPEPKRRGRPRKGTESTSKASIVDMLSNFLEGTRHCLEQPVSKNATVLAYWDTLLTGMSQQNSQRAVFKVTEFLQEVAKKEVEKKRLF
ncbi:uncharacterized protein [Drosophila kikkawai]|uniref:MADF domain-containing protein n=1 Tax=Drosophila kikkawai TaxID=30033 RepID=A0A6P4IRU9_DROKI|nr:uncharacterized protein LOC108080823 [Drosophila kikkawai]